MHVQNLKFEIDNTIFFEKKNSIVLRFRSIHND